MREVFEVASIDASHGPGIYRGQHLGVDAVCLRSAELDVVVLAGKGGDIWSLRHRPTGLDPFWKPRWARRPFGATVPVRSGAVAWMDLCRGGMQVMTPNGATEYDVHGVEQPDHSEASMVAWEMVATTGPPEPAVELRTWLNRSPLRIDRTISLRLGGNVHLQDTLTNEGHIPSPVSWTAHPSLSAPFLNSGCSLETNALSWAMDDQYAPEAAPYPPGASGPWPDPDGSLGSVPGRGARAFLAWLTYREGPAQFVVTNPNQGVAFGMEWDGSQMPVAGLFQEWRATPTWPWFRAEEVLTFEPCDRRPGQPTTGDASHGELQPGESRSFGVHMWFRADKP